MPITTVDYQVGDVLEFKKTHPCGGKNWLVLRTGVDFKLECTTCKRVIMLPRVMIAKKTKKAVRG